MIKDIPTKSDFDAIGCALLDQSWDIVAVLLTQLQDAKGWIDVEAEDAYWQLSNTKLSTALAIAHQGAEFLLKGRIADVSPLLLILNAPREWPKPGPDGNIAFSQFRTVDAQDIVRLHDGCAATPLDKDFATSFEALRIRRNSIMHSVNPDVKVNATMLIDEILTIYKSLMPAIRWVDARREALSDSSASHLWTAEGIEVSVVREFNAIKDLLTPKSMLQNFGFDKKRRAYICSNCTFSTCAEDGFQSRSATLLSKSPTCEELHCFICNQTENVERTECTDADCNGNVISTEWDKCLTCGGEFERPED